MSDKWLSVDPGEDTGYAIWQGDNLLEAGTEKLWPFGDDVFDAVFADQVGQTWDPNDESLPSRLYGIRRLVVEDFRVYPWEARKGTLDWDQVRTARLIGALTLAARRGGLDFVLQPAKIKERAEAAGAAELFLKPLYENRHANDAIRHGIYYLAIQRGATAVEQALS